MWLVNMLKLLGVMGQVAASFGVTAQITTASSAISWFAEGFGVTGQFAEAFGN